MEKYSANTDAVIDRVVLLYLCPCQVINTSVESAEGENLANKHVFILKRTTE